MNGLLFRPALLLRNAVIEEAMAYSSADIRMADRHIAQGERHIVQQEELISRLRSRGLPTDQAEDLLAEFEATLHQHRDHRTLMMISLGGEA